MGWGSSAATPSCLSARDVQVGRGEPISDTARVLSRYLDALVIRWHAHDGLEEFARHATVPIINGLTDLTHPCQVLADLLTMREAFGSLAGRRVAWIGDGNNMANAWLDAAALFGLDLRMPARRAMNPTRPPWSARRPRRPSW